MQQRESSNVDKNLVVGKHVSIAPQIVDMLNVKQTSFVIRNHTRGSLAFKLQTTHPQLLNIHPTYDLLRFSDSFIDIKVSTNLDPDFQPPPTMKIQVQTCPVLKPMNKEELLSNDMQEHWKSSADVDKQIVKLITRKVIKRTEGKNRPHSRELTDLQFEIEVISAALIEVSKQHEELISISADISHKNDKIIKLAETNADLNLKMFKSLQLVCIMSALMLFVATVKFICRF